MTVFTLDLALLLKAGARLDDALELLAADIDIGRLRPTVAKVRASVLSGESFADALVASPGACSRRCTWRSSGSAKRRARSTRSSKCWRTNARAPRRCGASSAMRCATRLSCCSRPSAVLVFFLFFVLPQFAAVLRDFGAKLDPFVAAFIGLSDFLRANKDMMLGGLAALLLAVWLVAAAARGARRGRDRGSSRLPLVRSVAIASTARPCSAAISASCSARACR